MTTLEDIIESEGGEVSDRNDPIAQRLAEIEASDTKLYRHFKPLTDAANEFIAWAETPHLRVYTGIPVLDAAMRGTAPGEITIIQGFTHSGKTLVATEILLNNNETPFLVFSPDETRQLILVKLTAARTGVNAREMEKRIQQDDAEARNLMIETAKMYDRLAVFDDSVTLIDMDRMLAETSDAFGEKPRAFMFDYADLLSGFDDVRQAISALKAWGKRHNLPGFILHQASRTSGSSGRKMTIDSGAYGGEQQATHVIGVRRKKYAHMAQLALLEEKIANASNPNSIAEYQSRMNQIRDELIPMDENTVTISLVKNKRPPCDLVDDLDYMIDPGTGRLCKMDQFKDKNGDVIRVQKAQLTYLRSDPKPWEEQEMF